MTTQYKAFIDEYFLLNHMEKIVDSVDSESNKFYIPHHAVFRPKSSLTPLRVVSMLPLLQRMEFPLALFY